MLRQYKSHIIFLLALIVIVGCRSKIENKITGTWKRIIIEDVNSIFQENWIFYDDGRLNIYKDANWQSPVETDSTARYMINATWDSQFLKINDASIPYYNGTWEIVQMDKETMMIVKRPAFSDVDVEAYGGQNIDQMGGLLFREFTKVK